MTFDPNGRVLTVVTGGETSHAKCWSSVIGMIRREQDDPTPLFGYGTKGYEVRQGHINRFMEGDWDWLLMLDGDMVFAADTLERLRSHGKGYVSGYYVRRQIERPYPVWYRFPESDDVFDPVPFFDVPERGRLYRLGGSGWGCILLHRQVIADTRHVLAGEWDVLEDDMDVWPHDAAAMRQLIDDAREQLVTGYRLGLEVSLNRLAVMYRLLRPAGKHDPVGSDIRYTFYARKAGHILYGDPDVRPGHLTNFPVTPDQWDETPQEERDALVATLMRENGRVEEAA